MPAPASLTPSQIQEISDWLIDAALATTTLPDLVEGFCGRLNAAGLDLRRITVGTRLLHPTQESQTVRWIRGAPLEVVGFETAAIPNPDWLASPLRTAIENPGIPIRRRLEGDAADFDYPILAELKGAGDTDYFVFATGFDAFSRPDRTTGMIVTWSTDRPGGFRDHEIAAIERLQPRFAVAVKCALLPQIAYDVVAAYIGADAGRRILGGDVDRGSVGDLEAALFFCDMRGFTALADRLDNREMIALLDGYFDAIVTPIEERGGQVLKFLGDGLLATFGIDGADPAPICARALDAAIAALATIRDINGERANRSQPTLDLDVALHQGRVVYGKVGARNRLDFTVIGPAVNEASRLEALCDELDVRLIHSQSFVETAGASASRPFRSLGAHAIRGVEAPRELFTVDLEKG